jgi:hypothetical protein
MNEEPHAIGHLVIFYEIGMGVAERPVYLRYWQQQVESIDAGIAFVRSQANAGRVPGRMNRPLPPVARHDHEHGVDHNHAHPALMFEDQDLSISIEPGNNLYAIRLVGSEEQDFYGRAMFADRPIELEGVSAALLPQIFSGLSIDLTDGGSRNTRGDATARSWLTFSCDRSTLAAAVSNAVSPNVPVHSGHFQVPFHFNLIDRVTMMPVWMNAVRTTGHHTGSRSSSLNGGRKGILEHGGFHPDFVRSYLYV